MTIGHLAHCLILTPSNFGDGKSHVIQPAEYPDEKGNMKRWNGNSNFCKAWKDENEGKMILSPKELRTVQNMSESFKFDPFGAQLLEFGHKEVAAFWKDPVTNLLMKAKLDLFAPVEGGIIIVDLKKVGQDDDYAFVKACADLDYPVQNATYRTGISILTETPLDQARFIHAAIPDKAPHCISFTEMDLPAQRAGERLMRRGIDDYAEALATNNWKKIKTISLPDYYLNK